jgi:hypothetical protein
VVTETNPTGTNLTGTNPTGTNPTGNVYWWHRLAALRWVPAAFWAGLIWFASSFDWRTMPWTWSFGDGGGWHFAFFEWLPADKFFHAEIFMIFALLLRAPMRLRGARAFTTTVLLATTWGIIDEVHQSFVPGRMPDPWDATADLCGALLGAALLALWLDALWPRIRNFGGRKPR